ncbi:MAG: hypothetical protein HY553_15795 [Elusimicrobia bacterium]|nr:hypothetical protein [Elusimicrobiota bacterium]
MGKDMARRAAAAAVLLGAGCAGVPTREPVPLSELRKQGAVLQAHEYSCGAAALATLMGLFGKPVGEAELLKRVFPKGLPLEAAPDGKKRLRALNLEDLERGARDAGFSVVSLQLDARGVERSLSDLKPAIARMYLYQSYLHFVVLRDIKDGWVSITDPAYGHVKLPAGQFLAAWDKGDRVLLAVGRKPFYAWKTRDGGAMYLKRQEDDRVASSESLDPTPLYGSIHRRLPELGSLPR